MLTSLLGAMTLATLGPISATHHGSNAQLRAPQIIEIRADMINTGATNRGQIRFSNNTQGHVVAESNADGSINWSSSDREKLGGQDAASLIYVQIFDGVFAIDPFQPLPAASKSTAQMLFRGTTLETDRTQHGRTYIERTEELFEKLEQARHNWLRENGFYGVRVFTNNQTEAVNDQQAKADTVIKPAAVFERPADHPRVKSREQVRSGSQDMSGVVAMLMSDDEPVRISLPHNMASDVVARIEKRNESQAQTTEVASRK